MTPLMPTSTFQPRGVAPLATLVNLKVTEELTAGGSRVTVTLADLWAGVPASDTVAVAPLALPPGGVIVTLAYGSVSSSSTVTLCAARVTEP